MPDYCVFLNLGDLFNVMSFTVVYFLMKFSLVYCVRAIVRALVNFDVVCSVGVSLSN